MQQYLLQDINSGIIVRLQGRESAIKGLLTDVVADDEMDTLPNPNGVAYFQELQNQSTEYNVTVEPFVDMFDVLE